MSYDNWKADYAPDAEPECLYCNDSGECPTCHGRGTLPHWPHGRCTECDDVVPRGSCPHCAPVKNDTEAQNQH